MVDEATPQPCRELGSVMTQRASIAALLHDLDLHSPAGFAIALHIRFSAPRYMFQTYAKRWLDHYDSAGLLVADPVVGWGMQNVGCITWAELESIDSLNVMGQAKDFGLMNGVAISIFSSGTRSIGGFARADRDFERAEIAEMERLLTQLHDATIDMPQLSREDQAALRALSIRLTH